MITDLILRIPWRIDRHAAVTAALPAMIIVAAACGGGSGGGGNPTAPTPPLQAPPPASSQPPSVNVNGLWVGTYTRNGGSGTIKLSLTQNGGSVTGGDGISEDQARGGDFVGTLSGNTLVFSLHFGMNCVRTLSGTATIVDDTMTGTFSGGGPGCPEGPITNGQMSLKIPRPTPPPLLGTTWWGGFGPTGSPFGANFAFFAWLWQFTQEASSNSNGIVDIGGSVKMGPGAPSNFGPALSAGTVTGTLTQDFICPGLPSDCIPHYFWRVAFTITLAGTCSAALSVTDNQVIGGEPFVGAQAVQFNGTVSGTTCNGPASGVGFNLCQVGSSQCQ
jgi:hypothetical protein